MSNLVTKNNLKVKLADGLTPFGMSQVKKEIGGSSGGGLNLNPLYCQFDEVNQVEYLLNPSTKELYNFDYPDKYDKILEIINQILQDYGFDEFIPYDGEIGDKEPLGALYSENKYFYQDEYREGSIFGGQASRVVCILNLGVAMNCFIVKYDENGIMQDRAVLALTYDGGEFIIGDWNIPE